MPMVLKTFHGNMLPLIDWIKGKIFFNINQILYFNFQVCKKEIWFANMGVWRVNIWLDDTRSNRESSIRKTKKGSFFPAKIQSAKCERKKMPKSQFRTPFLVSFSLLLFIFNLTPSHALYGASSPVLQLTPSNFKSKVNQVYFFTPFSITSFCDLTVFAIFSNECCV